MTQRGLTLAAALLCAAACGARTELLAGASGDAAIARDGSVEDSSRDADASASGDAAVGPPCNLGTVVGDVFGSRTYFAGGATLPGGKYRASYVDGCMRYNGSPTYGWSVDAYGLGDPMAYHWWFVSNDQQITTVIPPGTVGFLLDAGGFATFDECVTANLAVPPVELTVPGGTLGVWLEDNPYSDNSPGPNGRSPTWSLECVP